MKQCWRSGVLVERRNHRVLALVEIARGQVGALLECDRRKPGARELPQDDRSASPRPDDDGVHVASLYLESPKEAEHLKFRFPEMQLLPVDPPEPTPTSSF